MFLHITPYCPPVEKPTGFFISSSHPTHKHTSRVSNPKHHLTVFYSLFCWIWYPWKFRIWFYPTHTQITMNSYQSDYRITETQWFDPLGFSLHTLNNHTKVSLGNSFFYMIIRSSISLVDFYTLVNQLIV